MMVAIRHTTWCAHKCVVRHLVLMHACIWCCCVCTTVSLSGSGPLFSHHASCIWWPRKRDDCAFIMQHNKTTPADFDSMGWLATRTHHTSISSYGCGSGSYLEPGCLCAKMVQYAAPEHAHAHYSCVYFLICMHESSALAMLIFCMV